MSPSKPICCAGILALVLSAVPAFCQVIEVAPDGIKTYAGPVVSGLGDRSQIASAPKRTAAPLVSPPRTQVLTEIAKAADRHALSRRLIEAVAWTESRLNPAAMSPKGAQGVMQLMAQTSKHLGVDRSSLSGNVEGGTRYMEHLLKLYDGDILLALAAYNAGPDAVRRYGGVPPFRETQGFIDSVLNRLSDTAPPSRTP